MGALADIGWLGAAFISYAIGRLILNYELYREDQGRDGFLIRFLPRFLSFSSLLVSCLLSLYFLFSLILESALSNPLVKRNEKNVTNSINVN